MKKVTPQEFETAFNAARVARPIIVEMTSTYTHEDTTLTPYLTEDGQSGFCLSFDGYFSHLFSAISGRGDELVNAAVEMGASRLDCFDGYLPALYARHGFYEDYREPNWDAEGGPDVIYMKQ